MNKKELGEILQEWNFWEKDLTVGVNRDLYLKMLEGSMPSELIKVIMGVRRSGKSYIMKQLARWLMDKKGVNKDNILIINFEDPRFIDLSTKLIQQVFDFYLETYQPQGEIYVFLDEVQELPRGEKWVRMMQELDKANIIVSGSNSKLLSGELATTLTGRHLDITVMPLSFSEFLCFKNLAIKNDQDLIT
jgi:hypothetical protein